MTLWYYHSIFHTCDKLTDFLERIQDFITNYVIESKKPDHVITNIFVPLGTDP